MSEGPDLPEDLSHPRDRRVWSTIAIVILGAGLGLGLIAALWALTLIA